LCEFLVFIKHVPGAFAAGCSWVIIDKLYKCYIRKKY